MSPKADYKRTDEAGLWCEIVWDGTSAEPDRRGIKVYVDWDVLSSAEARELADVLRRAADDLDAEGA